MLNDFNCWASSISGISICFYFSFIFSLSCQAEKNAFVVADLGALLQQHVLWQNTLPLVQPFYPVKCNSSPAVIEILAALGVGFVCANKVTFSCFTIPHRFICMICGWALKIFLLTPFCFPCKFFRLKSQWYSNTMSPPRTSSCLVFANSSHTSSTLLKTASTTWCVITRPSSEKSHVSIQTPSQFPFANKHMFGILYLMPQCSISCIISFYRLLLQLCTEAQTEEASMVFGCSLKSCRHLLEAAKELGVDVVGVV